ncbi:DNASE1L [Mytilus edulis]|uniref:DNASE1L n=1 Tax=Mytilus edulis TaxID=6550 RepID=A0A8S3TSD4_MYTED|nr:DNASE1L [Mytilus edulis]
MGRLKGEKVGFLVIQETKPVKVRNKKKLNSVGVYRKVYMYILNEEVHIENEQNILNILCINCCGLKSRINYPEFSELIYKNDIACFVETKTDDLDDIRLKGYKFILKNRKKVSRIKSGGIALCFKEHLHENIEVIKTDCKFVLWCKISKIICSNQDVILGIIYIPPEYTSYSSSSALDEIENEYLDLSRKFEKVFFIGDFNARTAEDRDFIYVNENDICTYDEGVTVNMVCELDEKLDPEKE